MTKPLSYAEDIRLHYDPEKPAARFLKTPLAAGVTAEAALPKPLPWPANLKPTPAPLAKPPAETDDLSKFAGYDAVVITYTSAEAATLAALLTPGHPISTWYEYRHNIPAYEKIVTGGNAPFNSTDKEDARYYHSLGLYFPCTIGKSKVLLLKSGLHPDYDTKHDDQNPPAVIPMNKMVTELVQTVKPKILITTGTGGGIGSDVKLGDVVIAGQARFDCTQQFAKEKWAKASYKTSPLPAKALSLMTPALLGVNAAKVAAATPIPGRPEPKIWSGSSATIVTTDVFAFDTSSNTPFHLQGLGQTCDMGDAMVGQAMQQFQHVSWYAIRNASDPQIPAGQIPSASGPAYKAADKEAGDIYQDYGSFTTAASVIATWAIIAA
jgi:Phosphorylase superfamily